jgi:hypothetical protein
MATTETAEQLGELNALLDTALKAADALELEMVAAHLSMAKDALLVRESVT